MRKQIQIVVLILILLSLSCSSFSKSTTNNLAINNSAINNSELSNLDKVAYIIPKDYIGGVIILFDNINGVMPKTANDGTILYEIPKDGLLKVKYTLKGGAFKYNFYYADKENNLTPIQYVHPQGSFIRPEEKSIDTLTEEEKNTKICVMDFKDARFKVKGKDILLNIFSIGYPKDGKSIYLKMLDKVDELNKTLSEKQS